MTTPNVTDNPCEGIANLEQITVKYVERLMVSLGITGGSSDENENTVMTRMTNDPK